jgi:hypothetical protein
MDSALISASFAVSKRPEVSNPPPAVWVSIPWTGYRWLREVFLAHRCNGLSAEAAQSELGFFTAKALVWRRSSSPAWVMGAITCGAVLDGHCTSMARRGTGKPLAPERTLLTVPRP